MNNFLSFLALFILLQSCSTSSESQEDLITKIEAGLSGPIYIEGDSTWTIESRMAHYGVPGVSIAAINGNEIVWVKSYGVMDRETKEPVTNQTLFQAGSISKPVAAYAALHLADQNKISLDENVNTYLKSWTLPDNEFTTKGKVTLKHILSHTAGLTVHGFLGYSSDLPIPTLVQVLDGVPPANSQAIRVDKVPGESFRYSGGGYTVMQEMLMDVEGKTFPELMNDIVLQPLGMKSSTYEQPLPGDKVNKAATGYLPDGTQTKGKFHTYPEMAAAGLWTTAEDLAKFVIDVQHTVHGQSTKVLSQPMAEKMLTPFVSDFEGLGLFLTKKKDDFYFGHGGWDEGFSSELVAHRDKGYGVVVLTNSNHPEFISEVIHAVARTYNWSDYMHTYTKMDMDSSLFPSIIGRYHHGNDGTIQISGKNNRLFLKYLRGKESFELFRISDSTYLSHDAGHGLLPLQFKINPMDHTLNVVFVESEKPAVFIHAKESEDIKVPFEYLLAGDLTTAIAGYRALQKADPHDHAVEEENINTQGYNLLSDGKIQLAKDVFKVNMVLYPGSSNVYDSYAEASMKNGEKEEASLNYKKSLSMDPKNANAKAKLEELNAK